MNFSTQIIQRRLNELGFGPLNVDGVRGPRTDAAIIAFKKSIGLRPRPFVGPLTYAALLPRAKDLDTDASLPWMQEALLIKGLHESRDYSALRGWFDKSVAWIDPREVAWCGAFVATALRRWDAAIEIPDNPLGARNWGKFADATSPQFGAILTFWRGSKSGWKGHVGFYWGEDATAYHVLGGNQSNAVTVTRIAKNRLLDARWPKSVPRLHKVIRVNSAGQPLSTNEA